MKKALLILALLASAAAVASSAAAAAPQVQLTPVGRLPFPDRGYVVDLPAGVVAGRSAVRVRENGRPVRNLQVTPIGTSGIRYGVVVALDASDSMRGAPMQAAVAAARSFVKNRPGDEEVGIVAFNGAVRVLRTPTSDPSLLARALSQPPRVAYRTRIYDALSRSLTLLEDAQLSTGSIVLLSDGADLGSHTQVADVLRRARAQHVRVFTVGLRSGAFEARPLQTLAERTGGTYVKRPRQSGCSRSTPLSGAGSRVSTSCGTGPTSRRTPSCECPLTSAAWGAARPVTPRRHPPGSHHSTARSSRGSCSRPGRSFCSAC